MTERQAAERGVHFPAPWVFSTRDLIIFGALAILFINAIADHFYEARGQAAFEQAQPVIAAVNLAEVYQSAQTHFLERGESRERANLSVALLMPEIDASVARLRSSETFSYVLTVQETVPEGTVDLTHQVVEDILSTPQTLTDVLSSAYVQN